MSYTFSKAAYIINMCRILGLNGGDNSWIGLKVRRKALRLNRWDRRKS